MSATLIHRLPSFPANISKPSLISKPSSIWIAVPLGICAAALAAFAITRLGPGATHQAVLMAAVLACSVASSIAGFAFSAVAGGAVYHLVDTPVEAVTILISCSIAIQAYSVFKMRKSIEWSRVLPFLLGGSLTVIPFSWLVVHLNASTYLVTIGALLIAYGVYMLFRKPMVIKVGDRTARAIDVAVGAIGGITGPLAGIPGPAINIWCGMRGWDKVRQRATFQPYILIMQITALVLISLFKGSNNLHFAGEINAIPALIGCHFGLILFKKISTQHFNYIVYLLLIVSGVSLFLK